MSLNLNKFLKDVYTEEDHYPQSHIFKNYNPNMMHGSHGSNPYENGASNSNENKSSNNTDYQDIRRLNDGES